MAVTFVAADNLAANATTTTLNVVAPTVNVDDILVAAILGKDNQVISVPANWTKFVEVNNTTAQRLTLAWKRAVAGDSGATFAFTKPTDNNILFCGVISAWRGAITTGSPIDATTPTTSANASGDTVTYATFDPTETTGYVIAVGVYNENLTTAGTISGTNPTLLNRWDLETATGTDGSIFGYSGDSDGAATGARSHATTSTADAISIGCLFGLKAGATTTSQSVTDTATISEAVAQRIASVRAEAAGLSEAVRVGPSRALAETLTMTEAIARQARKAAQDAVAFTEALGWQVSSRRTDAPALAEALVRAAVSGRADTVGLSDALRLTVGMGAADALAGAEALVRMVGSGTVDAVAATELLGRAIQRQVAEQAVITEALAKDARASAAETIALSEALAAVRQKFSAVVDLATFAETVRLDSRRGIAETLSALEGLSARTGLGLAESIALTESLSTRIGIGRAEALSLVEALAMGASRGLGETLAAAEALGRSAGWGTGELGALTEALRTAAQRGGLADTLSPGETLAAALGNLVKSLNDAAALAETLARRTARSLVQTISLAEQLGTDVIHGPPPVDADELSRSSEGRPYPFRCLISRDRAFPNYTGPRRGRRGR